MIAYFEKSLVEHLGEAARGAFSDIGLSNTNFIQVETGEGKLESFIEIAYAALFDPSRCTMVMTEEEANALIAERFIPRYDVTNQTLMSVSLTQKMNAGTLSLEEIDPAWDAQQQNAFLYDKGVLGIAKSSPRYFAVTE